MKIIITGAAGFIASHLCIKLKGFGIKVIGIDSLSKMNKLRSDTVGLLKYHNIDIYKRDLVCDDISDVIKDSDFVFHLAAQTGLNNETSSEEYFRNNVLATTILVKQIKNICPQLKGLINVSTSSVYGSKAINNENSITAPISDYGKTKLFAEKIALSMHYSNKFPVCSIRPYSIFGPREREDKLIPQILLSEYKNVPFKLYENSLGHFRSYTFVEDIVKALVRCIEKWEYCKGEIINFGNPESLSTAEIIKIIEEKTNKKIIYDLVPSRKGDQLITKAQIEKAKKILNFVPQVKFETGLEKQLNWFQNYMNN